MVLFNWAGFSFILPSQNLRYCSFFSFFFVSRADTERVAEMNDNMEDAARPWQSYHTVYTNAKAGMDGVDKEKVQRIVYEMSKGSKYFENEERKEALIKQRIENMRAQCAKLTAADISHYQMIADKRILELESGRDLSKTWLHVDMDAFYAAVAILENPLLKGKPMAVGSMSMISTANYEARKYGVRAAMPGFIARKLCPDLIFVPTDFKKYTYYSDLTRKVFQKYDPNFIASGLDEAYLDITEVCKGRGISSGEIAEELRTCIYEETGLTCSAGVAPNRLLAKVCSDINKPNGQFVLPNDRMAVVTFVSSLPIRKIGGIGKVTEHILSAVLGINTCEEMLQKCAILGALFSHSSADFFLSVGLGLGKTDPPEVRSRKSISSERTFSATNSEAFLYKKLVDIAATLSSDMEKEGLSGRTLTLKLKTASFEVRTRAVSLQCHINSSEDILNHASKLLKAELPLSLRLIGIRMAHFDDEKIGHADPMQKKLTSFVISGDASAKLTSGNSSMSASSDNSVKQLMVETGICLPIDANKTSVWDPHHNWSLENPSDSNQLFVFEHSHDVSSNTAGDTVHSFINLRNDCQAEEVTSDPIVSGLEMVETESFSSYSETNHVDKLNKQTNLLESNQKQAQNLWIDDYKCALCGAELPPSFIEERQEHSDYHFAEMLQKEESEWNKRDLMQRQRSGHKFQIARESKRKKQKTSPKDGSHLPIDMFFAKTSQNF